MTFWTTRSMIGNDSCALARSTTSSMDMTAHREARGWPTPSPAALGRTVPRLHVVCNVLSTKKREGHADHLTVSGESIGVVSVGRYTTLSVQDHTTKRSNGGARGPGSVQRLFKPRRREVL